MFLFSPINGWHHNIYLHPLRPILSIYPELLLRFKTIIVDQYKFFQHILFIFICFQEIFSISLVWTWWYQFIHIFLLYSNILEFNAYILEEKEKKKKKIQILYIKLGWFQLALWHSQEIKFLLIYALIAY